MACLGMPPTADDSPCSLVSHPKSHPCTPSPPSCAQSSPTLIGLGFHSSSTIWTPSWACCLAPPPPARTQPVPAQLRCAWPVAPCSSSQAASHRAQCVQRQHSSNSLRPGPPHESLTRYPPHASPDLLYRLPGMLPLCTPNRTLRLLQQWLVTVVALADRQPRIIVHRPPPWVP